MRCPIENTDRQRCTLDENHAGAHEFRPRTAGPLAGRVTTLPRCPGCGTTSVPTALWPSGEPCAVCSQNPRFQAPKATIEVGVQPEPAYQRAGYTGHFRRTDPAE